MAWKRGLFGVSGAPPPSFHRKQPLSWPMGKWTALSPDLFSDRAAEAGNMVTERHQEQPQLRGIGSNEAASRIETSVHSTAPEAQMSVTSSSNEAPFRMAWIRGLFRMSGAPPPSFHRTQPPSWPMGKWTALSSDLFSDRGAEAGNMVTKRHQK